MKRLTKKEAILQICEREQMGDIAEREVRLIKARLGKLLGERGQTSDSYIISVLREAGKRILVTSGFSSPLIEDEYIAYFEGVLKFDSLENAEKCIRQLDELYRTFKVAGDEKGVAYTREIALLGKRRARAAARSAKKEEVRRARAEVAEWFTIWLYSPEIFDDWLYLRKRSPEFQQNFRPPDHVE